MTNKKEKIDFPCHFPIKIIGNNHADFIGEMRGIIVKHFPDFDLETILHKQSRNKNYISLTITVYVLNQTCLDAFYQEVSSHPQVHMIL
ncbi:YbeD family protein [Legionella israelensis]|uniref:Uncharacterized protein n=1 Tax=Legionella israelensis TaxID=454 RepID=A0A0W0VUB8_9GAMM|nr:DUF493 domain-containing protein [Legionella israelensis]KTD23647.1 hypothetical protein Lisr_1328 [Legionella israelensis]QBS08613.1 DUF493 domain-containing protein [Legionella israelensis]SCY38739.1 hypothetical protein SAMN02746069_02271 [Legionella israelensis DSM 19235]STX58271.1 putative lipoate regulatory protein YbeD [Legionella israelensis]